MMCNDTLGTGGVLPPVLKARVTDAQGEPIADATVTFSEDSPPHQDMGQITNDDGVFFYPTLETGTYTLLINDPTGVQARLQVDVDPVAPKDLNIILLRPIEGEEE